jgi:alpha-mannosidase
MNTIATLTMLLLFAAQTFSQTSVESLTAGLDSLGKVSFDLWKVSPDLKLYQPEEGSPSQPDFDDSGWETLRVGEAIYPDSCWLRTRIVLPQKLLGEPISGTLKLQISVDDYGELWVDGRRRGEIPWSAEHILTRDARPGQTLHLAVKAYNTGGPLALLRADLQSATSSATQARVENLSLSLRVAQKLLGFDTYQTSAREKTDPGIDRSRMDREEKQELNARLQRLASRIDLDALAEGDVDRFFSSVDAVLPQLQPIQEFARRFTLVFDANAHIDAAWLWREKETVEVCKNTFGSVLSMMDARPDFTYTQSSAIYYDWMGKLYPDLLERIRGRVRDGRWSVVGGMWVEPDCNLPDGVSWARQLLYGKRYFARELSADVTTGWNPDSFGYTWTMPMFYQNAGIDAFITQKIGWNDTNVFPHRIFWWESPDGSRILSYFPFTYVYTVEDPFRTVDWLRQFEANTGFTRLLVLVGVGDHGGGPDPEMLGRIDRLKDLLIFPRVEFGTSQKYLEWLRRQDLSSLPVWRDELYLEYHRGTYTTQAAVKAANREGEVLLTNAEKFSTLASLHGKTYPSENLRDAWKILLFNQFHDILPGSSIRQVFLDAAGSYGESREIGRHELRASLEYLAGKINTASLESERTVIVFNPLAWDRTDVARIELPPGETDSYAVFDAEGTELPSQTIRTGRYRREIIFLARDIPSLGYALYQLREGEPTGGSHGLKSSPRGLENASFSIKIDPSTGWIESVRDKRTDREVLQGPGNRLQVLEDLPSAWDAWNIGLTGVEYPTTYRGASVIEEGPVRTVLRVHHDVLKPGEKGSFPTETFPTSFFVQDILLYDGLDRIDFRTAVDWWEDRTMLKVAFPLALGKSRATFEIPYGTIERSTVPRNSVEAAKTEVPALRWADLSDSGYGVSLLNGSKYGYDARGNTLRLSLLRSPRWPDPTADRGSHSIEYALYPHTGTWQEAETVRRGYELNQPLVSLLTDRHPGPLPARHSFIGLAPSSLVLTSLKKAEDSSSLVIQWYNTTDEPVPTLLRLPTPPGRVTLSNFLEEEVKPLSADGATLRLETGARSVITVIISSQ